MRHSRRKGKKLQIKFAKARNIITGDNIKLQLTHILSEGIRFPMRFCLPVQLPVINVMTRCIYNTHVYANSTLLTANCCVCRMYQIFLTSTVQRVRISCLFAMTFIVLWNSEVEIWSMSQVDAWYQPYVLCPMYLNWMPDQERLMNKIIFSYLLLW